MNKILKNIGILVSLSVLLIIELPIIAVHTPPIITFFALYPNYWIQLLMPILFVLDIIIGVFIQALFFLKYLG